jgi:hypothetical protein
MLTPREWSWIIASGVLAAMFVHLVLFATCHVLDGDCKIAWGQGQAMARAGQ